MKRGKTRGKHSNDSEGSASANGYGNGTRHGSTGNSGNRAGRGSTGNSENRAGRGSGYRSETETRNGSDEKTIPVTTIKTVKPSGTTTDNVAFPIPLTLEAMQTRTTTTETTTTATTTAEPMTVRRMLGGMRAERRGGESGATTEAPKRKKGEEAKPKTTRYGTKTGHFETSNHSLSLKRGSERSERMSERVSGAR